MAASKLRVALFECERLQEHLAPKVYERTGGYLNLLQNAFHHLSRRSPVSLPSVELVGFDTKAEQYPADVNDFAGVLISGSLSGVYDDDPWISRLLQEIKALDQKKVKTCGISFGHQAIAQAMGGKVKKNPKGSEVSVRSAALTEQAQKVFGTDRTNFRLHYHHNDAILELPGDLQVLASNNVTQCQSFASVYTVTITKHKIAQRGFEWGSGLGIVWREQFKASHFLTFCGHPDYSHNPEVLKELLGYDREKLWVHEQLIEYGLATLSQPTDYEWVLKQIVRFYSGEFEQGPSVASI